jgi:hypothetical protein
LFSGAAICFQELKEEREFAAQAAVMPVPAVLEILKNSGICRPSALVGQNRQD